MIKALVSLVSRLSKREKIIFFITVFLVFSLIVNHLILTPALSRIEALDKEIKKQKESICESLLILSRKDRITAEHNGYTPYFEKEESKNEEPVSFLKSIESLAKNSSVELLDIKPTLSQEKDLIKEYGASLSCEAPIEQIFVFLYSAGNLDQLLNVERINITPKADESNIVRCSMNVSKVLILPGGSELKSKSEPESE
jgi:Tfp pilus assembly protein PilO